MPRSNKLHTSSSPTSILNGNIEKSILNMTYSIALGFISLFAFNLIDTFFIAQLGSNQLAAVSFTFPIAFLWMNSFFGLNTGITSQVGQSLGKNQTTTAKYLTLNSLIFTVSLSILISIIGYFSINPIFLFLGAPPELLKYINQYMPYWYIGFPFLIIAVSCGAAIRGQGDAKTPSRIIMLSSLVNGILDPLFIFGLGPFPKLGITGAVLATIISWFVATLLAIYHILYKTNLLNLKLRSYKFHIINLRKNFFKNIKSILKIGIPSMLTNAINPLAHSIVVKIVALEGIIAIAGFGVGMKLEAFATLFSIALSMAIVPFMSINYGAKNYLRIGSGFKYAIKVVVITQLFIYLLLFALADIIAGLFSNNPEIINVIILYLRIIPGVYCCIGIIMIVVSALNAIEKAQYSTLINFIRFFLLTIPLAYIGQITFGIIGVLIGIVLAKVFSAFIALVVYRKVTN